MLSLLPYSFRFTCIAWMLALIPSLKAEYRSFSSSDGVTIEAELVEATKEKVTIRRTDGMVFKDVPLSRFSEADRLYVDQWLEEQKAIAATPDITAESKLRLYVLAGREEEIVDKNDDRIRFVPYWPQVVIQSEEKETDYRAVRGTLVILGNGMNDNDTYIILQSQDFVMDVLSRQKSIWEGQSFQSSYHLDKGGYGYCGYLLILRDREGQIILSKASNSSWEQNPRRVLAAKNSYGYNVEFTQSKQLMTTFGLPE